MGDVKITKLDSAISNSSGFNDNLEYLRLSIDGMVEYLQIAGKDMGTIKEIQAGLKHSDPFILNKAIIAACFLLADKRYFH